MKILSILFLGLLFWVSGVQAKVLVVTDIDDTIKISHILSTTDSVVSALETSNVFLGMGRLYSFLKKNWGRDAEIFYLTNAPSWLMQELHEEFLQVNKFPQGELSLVEFSESTETHKLHHIRAKLNTGRYQTVILVGDNGERDPFIYAQIQKEYPQLQIITFIHQLYSVASEDEDYQGIELQENQVGFVTPIEILLELTSQKLVSSEASEPLMDLLARQVRMTTLDEDTGQIMFPFWEDCRDFQWKWSADREQIRLLKSFVLNRCSQNPEENNLWRLSKIDRKK